MLPVVRRVGVGAVWGVHKRTYPAEFIAMLATMVNTPALVFHTLMTTWLDNAQLLGVGSANLLGLALAAVFSGIALRSLNIAGAHARARGFVSQHRQPRASHRAIGVRRHRATGRGRQLHLRAAVQHLRRRSGWCGAGVDCSVRGAVFAAHLAGERKAVLIRSWRLPASPHA